MILNDIIQAKRGRISKTKSRMSLSAIKDETEGVKLPHRFKVAISKQHKVNLIAELKKASPINGLLRKDFDVLRIATIYRVAGASALSILTEEDFFQGSLDNLDIARSVGLPMLRKDFVIDEYQIYETVYKRADAILLICDLLSEQQLSEYLSIADDHGLDALVEVHNEEDIEKALSAGADIIGINNRDLHTFKVDLAITKNLKSIIPHDKVVVSESGIRTRDNVMLLKSLGINAVLVGETFMRSDDIAATVKELIG